MRKTCRSARTPSITGTTKSHCCSRHRIDKGLNCTTGFCPEIESKKAKEMGAAITTPGKADR